MGIERIFLSREKVEKLRKSIEEMAFKKKKCEEAGHPNEKAWDYVSKYSIKCFCSDCKSIYERPTSESEKREFDRQVYLYLEPMTV